MDKTLVDYFIEQTNSKFREVSGRFDKVDERFDRQDEKLDSLFTFKWKIIGMSTLASFVLTLGLELLVTWAHK